MQRSNSATHESANSVYLYPSNGIKKGTFLGGDLGDAGIMMHMNGETTAPGRKMYVYLRNISHTDLDEVSANENP